MIQLDRGRDIHLPLRLDMFDAWLCNGYEVALDPVERPNNPP